MPRRYPESVKRKAVADWKSGRRSAKQISGELQITTGLLSKWGQRLDKVMREEKPEVQKEPATPVTEPATENTLPVVRHGRADEETKARAVAEFAKKEKTAKELATEYGVRDVTIYAWVKAAKKKKGGEAIGPRAAAAAAAAAFSSGMETARMFMKGAADRISEITCPCGCGHTFRAAPLDLTAALVIVAYHLANGEEL